MTGSRLSRAERIDWLRLARTARVGPVTFAQLLARHGTPAAALKVLPALARRGGMQLVPVDPDRAARELDATEALGGRVLMSCEPDYPPLLAALDPPPPVITVLGDPRLAARPTVALVGARNASAAGRKIARDMAGDLGRAGYVTVSGLARGIDGEVHAASLESGTIAVLGGGVDHVYPPQHEALYDAVTKQGLIVSESPLGHRATARDFPRRNRLITGLAMGVVVVEAAERSGSLISARTAAEQGRDVMAVPGSPLDPRAAGTNALLRGGASLVRDARDVLDVLDALPRLRLEAPSAPDYETEPDTDPVPTEQMDAVRAALTPYPLALDEIARAAGVGPARCAAILMELELAGEAETLPGGLAVRVV